MHSCVTNKPLALSQKALERPMNRLKDAIEDQMVSQQALQKLVVGSEKLKPTLAGPGKMYTVASRGFFILYLESPI